MQKLKFSSSETAFKSAVPVKNMEGGVIGCLVPVGEWLLGDHDTIEKIMCWRERSMRMFFTRFKSSIESTRNYLQSLSIAQDNRILFLMCDGSGEIVGHIGLAEVNGSEGELDNLIRGQKGGDSRLVYFSELALLQWCFESIELERIVVRLISYNWLVASLHEEVGFHVEEMIPLLMREEDGVVFHDPVSPEKSNVNYGCIRMSLSKEMFYSRNPWLKI